MRFISYAQNFEDVRLWRALKAIKKGRYIDIGAQAPTFDSVSKAFYLIGWRGVHVEATPHYAAALRDDRPDEEVVEAVVAEEEGEVIFFEIPGTGLSTGIREIAEHHAAKGYEIHEITVPVIPLASILDSQLSHEIHWMKIDVEGMEASVLRSWRDSQVRPWVLVIESTYPNSTRKTSDQWIDLVLERGYHEVHFDGLSSYFVSDNHRELDDAFRSPPNVFDDFEVSEHHFVARQLLDRSHARHAEEVRALELGLDHAQSQLVEAVNQVLDANEERERINKLAHVEEVARQYQDFSEREYLWAESIAKSTQMLSAYQARLDAAQGELASMAAEHAIALEARDNAMIAERAVQSKKIAAFQREINSLEAERVAQREKINRFETTVADLEAERSQLKALIEERGRVADIYIAELNARIGLQREMLNDHRTMIDEGHVRLSEAHVTHREQIASLWSDHDAVRRALGAVQGELKIAEHALQTQDLAHKQEKAATEQQISRLAEKIDWQADKLVKADHLLSQLTQSSEYKYGRRFCRIFAKLGLNLGGYDDSSIRRWRDTGVEAITSHDTSAPSHIEWPMKHAEITARSKARQPAGSLSELCSFSDVDFVHCAYLTILGRTPDSDGKNYYVARLRNGVSKLSLLRQLRSSPEGRGRDTGIEGLDGALRKARNARLPIIGPVIQFFAGGEGNGRLETRLRVLENMVSILRSEYHGELSSLRSELTSVESKIGLSAEQPRELAQHIVSHRTSHSEHFSVHTVKELKSAIGRARK